MIETRKLADLPVLPSFADDDEMVVRDVSAGDPSQAVTKTTIAALREAIAPPPSAPAKIQDTAGTTRVETEEDAGRVTITADGHRVLDIGAEMVREEAAADIAAGGRVAREYGNDLFGAGILGVVHRVSEGESGPTRAAAITLGFPDGYGGIDSAQSFLVATNDISAGELVSQVGAISNRDIGSTGAYMDSTSPGGSEAVIRTRSESGAGNTHALMQVVDEDDEVTSTIRVSSAGVEAITTGVDAVIVRPGGAPVPEGDDSITDWIARVESEAGGVPTKIENGTSRVEIASANGDIEIYRAGTRVGFFWGDSGGRVIIGGPNGARLTLPEASSAHALATSGGYQSALTSTCYLQLPSGVTSYMHGIYLAKAAADDIAALAPVPWTPSWSGVVNVDSVTHVEASVQVINDYVDVEGSLTVTPDAAGVTVVTASIGVAFAYPAVDKDGQASAGVPGVAVQPAGCRVSTDGTVSVAFDAASNAEHTVSFRVRYLKATP